MNLVINAQLHRTQQSASLILISEKQTNPSFTYGPATSQKNAKIKTVSNSLPLSLSSSPKYKKINGMSFDSISKMRDGPIYWISELYKNIKRSKLKNHL